MLLKNDKDRRTWLEAHSLEQGWRYWKCDMDMGRKTYRFDAEDATIICEDRFVTTTYPRKETTWSTRAWYLLKAADWDKPFEDSRTSVTLVLKYLRELGTLEVPG